MPNDADQSYVQHLEAALTEIMAQARAARFALCETELLVRLENIARAAETALDSARTADDKRVP